MEFNWACQVDYDCRIVFTFENEPDTEKDLIVLVDIGKHDEVYKPMRPQMPTTEPGTLGTNVPSRHWLSTINKATYI